MGKAYRRKLLNERRLVSDVVRVAHNIPLASCHRELDLAELSLLRMKTRPRISWDVLMMRAYALVANDQPELRQIYTRFPRPYLYEHSESVCLLTMARQYHGRERLFFARFGAPENHSLTQIQERYNYYRTARIEDVKQFRHQLWFARAPLPVRRAIWWGLFNACPRKRATHMGTFGMSLSQYKDAIGTQHLGPTTTTLGIDPRPRRGNTRLLLTFDHRVLDGKPAAETLQKLKTVLQTQITEEVKMLLRDQGLQPQQLITQKQHRLKLHAA